MYALQLEYLSVCSFVLYHVSFICAFRANHSFLKYRLKIYKKFTCALIKIIICSFIQYYMKNGSKKNQNADTFIFAFRFNPLYLLTTFVETLFVKNVCTILLKCPKCFMGNI